MINFIKKIRTKYEENSNNFNTLQKIVLAEANTKIKTATQGLLWLNRYLLNKINILED